jgi:HEAT repeat protein
MRALGQAAATPEVVSVLRSGVDDRDAWVRYYACQSLGKLQVTASADKIEALLDDAAGQVRVAAVEAIARLGGAHALAALEHASLASDLDVRRAALTGLARICRPSALAILLRAAESEDATTRLAAASAIAETTSPEAVSALIRVGSDPDQRVRAAAFDLLAARPEPQATRWLIERLAFDVEREHALSGLARPVEGRVEGILSALETADATTSAWLVEALLCMRRPNGTAAVEAALHLENVYARRAAAAALGNVDSAAARDALSRAATLDPDVEVRRLSAGAV